MTAPATHHAPAVSTARRVLHFAISRGPLVVFAVLLIYLSFKSEFFLEWRNIKSILRQSAPDAILASGLAVVVMAGGDDVVVGGIDISIPAAATLGVGLIADQLVGGTPLLWAFLLGAAAVLAVGVANAFLVVYVKLTPLLATLATLVASVGLYRWAISNRRITVLDHDFVNEVRDGDFLGIPIPALFMLGTLLVVGGIAHRTRFGIRMQAVGGNRSAAEIAGLRPGRYLAASFILASFCGVIASIVLIARGSGLSPGIEERLLVDMVLATFVGAAFSPRRVVTVPGAVAGAILVKALGNGFQLIQVDLFKIGMIKGVLILVVVASSALVGRLRQ